MKPLLKWPGSKRRVSAQLAARIRPHLSKNGRYVEPFAGSAAVYFELEPEGAVLVDICKPLMSFYEAVQREPDSVYDELEKILALPFTEDTYLDIKREWNANDFGPKFAARLLFLNRTGFNGLFRLNKKGGYNVAWGKLAKLPGFPSRDELKAASVLLQGASLYAKDYSDILRATHKGDVVYCDPPYYDLYDRYAGGGFKDEDHRRLARTLYAAVKRGVSIFASNIDCPQVRGMYADWASCDVIPVLHKISCKNEGRKTVNEIIISAIAPWGDPRQMRLFPEETDDGGSGEVPT
jgi:DNA adenine methylase